MKFIHRITEAYRVYRETRKTLKLLVSAIKEYRSKLQQVEEWQKKTEREQITHICDNVDIDWDKAPDA